MQCQLVEIRRLAFFAATIAICLSLAAPAHSQSSQGKAGGVVVIAVKVIHPQDPNHWNYAFYQGRDLADAKAQSANVYANAGERKIIELTCVGPQWAAKAQSVYPAAPYYAVSCGAASAQAAIASALKSCLSRSSQCEARSATYFDNKFVTTTNYGGVQYMPAEARDYNPDGTYITRIRNHQEQ